MTNIDISPEAVEMWTTTHGLSPAMRDNVQALSAALTESRVEAASAHGRMIADAEARGMRRAADIAKSIAGDACDTPDEIRGAAMVEYAILAAIPEGGDA